MTNITTIYALCHPITNEIRYIGKSIRPNIRLRSHRRMKSSNLHLNNWIKSVDVNPEMIVLDTVETGWEEVEQFWIAYFKFIGANLLNIAIGGGGCSGYVATEELKIRRSVLSIGNKYRLGIPHTEEARRKMSNSHKGKPKTESHKAAIGKAHIGHKYNVGKNHSLETKLLMSEKATGVNNSMYGKKLTESARRRVSRAGRLRNVKDILLNWAAL